MIALSVLAHGDHGELHVFIDQPALIHDVGHQGIRNTQLVAENTNIAAFYDEGRSIAEQKELG
jgi:hypothetical protein